MIFMVLYVLTYHVSVRHEQRLFKVAAFFFVFGIDMCSIPPMGRSADFIVGVEEQSLGGVVQYDPSSFVMLL